VGAVRGRNFGFPIDLAHRLYNSLLLSHKPWFLRRVQNRREVVLKAEVFDQAFARGYFQLRFIASKRRQLTATPME